MADNQRAERIIGRRRHKYIKLGKASIWPTLRRRRIFHIFLPKILNHSFTIPYTHSLAVLCITCLACIRLLSIKILKSIDNRRGNISGIGPYQLAYAIPCQTEQASDVDHQQKSEITLHSKKLNPVFFLANGRQNYTIEDFYAL